MQPKIAALLFGFVFSVAVLTSFAQDQQSRHRHYKIINLGTPGRYVKRRQRH
jgi:hypothetical protein